MRWSSGAIRGDNASSRRKDGWELGAEPLGSARRHERPSGHLPAAARDEAPLARRTRGRRAFARVYERHHQALYRYCRSLLHHEQDAQDALQSTMATRSPRCRMRTATSSCARGCSGSRTTSRSRSCAGAARRPCWTRRPSRRRAWTSRVAEREELRVLRDDLLSCQSANAPHWCCASSTGSATMRSARCWRCRRRGQAGALRRAHLAREPRRGGRWPARGAPQDLRRRRPRAARARRPRASALLRGCRGFRAELAARPRDGCGARAATAGRRRGVAALAAARGHARPSCSRASRSRAAGRRWPRCRLTFSRARARGHDAGACGGDHRHAFAPPRQRAGRGRRVRRPGGRPRGARDARPQRPSGRSGARPRGRARHADTDAAPAASHKAAETATSVRSPAADHRGAADEGRERDAGRRPPPPTSPRPEDRADQGPRRARRRSGPSPGRPTEGREAVDAAAANPATTPAGRRPRQRGRQRQRQRGGRERG